MRSEVTAVSDNYFNHLNQIDVSDHVEEKNGLSYLPWTDAWNEVKSIYPDANRTVYETESGCNYFTDGKTCWVKVGVTVQGIEHIEYLPVMNNRNQSIALDSLTSCDVNKAIQRATTKAIARHGIGLYIYRGEDLPEAVQQEQKEQKEKLAAAIAEVVALGTSLIKAGVTKEQLTALVAEKNGGNGNPNSIPSIEVAEAVKASLAEAKNASKKASAGQKKGETT